MVVSFTWRLRYHKHVSIEFFLLFVTLAFDTISQKEWKFEKIRRGVCFHHLNHIKESVAFTKEVTIESIQK